MTTTTASKTSAEFFVKGYKDYCARVKIFPSSTYRLCKFLFVDENEFYEYFESLRDLEANIWSALLQPVFDKLNASEEYATYSARERLLAFYFTFAETFFNEKPWLKTSFENFRWRLLQVHQLDVLKQSFLPYAREILDMAKLNEELTNRPVVEQYYENLLWMQLVATLDFWAHDESEDFSDTDVFIEKSTNLLFDLLGRNAADAAIDFGKFVVQQGKKH